MLTAESVIDRCRAALKLKTNKALAAHLQTSESGLCSRIKRNTLPVQLVIKVAEQTGLSLDWLILGKETAEPLTPAEATLLHGWRQLNPARRADLTARLLEHLDASAE